MGEVVKFSGSTTGFPSSEEDLMEKWTQTRMMYCDELVNTFFSKFASQLSQVGFPLDDKTFFLKYITAGEMMRSVLYDSYGLTHPHFECIVSHMEKTKELVADDDYIDDDYGDSEEGFDTEEE